MMIVMFKTAPRADIDKAQYHRESQRMAELVAQVPGFISVKRFASDDGENFTMVKFASEEALEAWRRHPEHVAAQRRGRETYYEAYSVIVCQSVREYEWRRDKAASAASA